jgi:hypothetical protein
MKVTIEVIPNNQQRYPTSGDWQWDGDNLTISVSKMGNWRYEMLVAFHELAECFICRHRGIQQEQVDDFDIKYESLRGDNDVSEPGDSLAAPYYREHQFSTCVERLLALELDVDWKQYDATVENL